MGFKADLITLLEYVLFLLALFPSTSVSKKMHECDVRKDSILKINATTYLHCQRTPEILSKVYDNNGIWFKWTCEKDGVFDFASCKPVLDEVYEELRQIMNDLVFCNEESSPGGDGKQKAKYQPSCEVDKAPLISDAHNIKHYYVCELDNLGDKCGHWSAHACGSGEIFNSTLQQCIGGAHSRGSRMGAMMVPPLPAYGGYLYPYDYAAYAAAYYGYPPVLGTMPVQSPALPVPTSVPMDALQQYYAAMYPWLFPNVMGKPVVAATGTGQAQGGGGGGQTSGGVSWGQTGGGILPDTSKLPGLNKLPGIGGGGGTGGSSLPGLGKLPGIG